MIMTTEQRELYDRIKAMTPEHRNVEIAKLRAAGEADLLRFLSQYVTSPGDSPENKAAVPVQTKEFHQHD
jgi:hypothetical protein